MARFDIDTGGYPVQPRAKVAGCGFNLPDIGNPRFRCSSGQACENALPVTYSNVEPSDFVQTFSRRNGGEATSGFFEVPKNETKENGIRLSERKETLGGVTHRILTVPIAQDQVGMYYQQPGQQLTNAADPGTERQVEGVADKRHQHHLALRQFVTAVKLRALFR